MSNLEDRVAGRPLVGAHVDEEAVAAVAARLESDLVELRRDIHRHPETAGHERRTAELVARRLRAAGLTVRTGVGGHGVVGVLGGAQAGRTVAYRADLDAVPPEAQIGGGTAPAHLCGHDLHTTIGVGAAEVLAHLRDQLAGTVVFVFQPAEESLAGAAAMLDDDVFGDVRPAEIHALHCGPYPVGEFAVMPGYGYAGQDSGVVTVTGSDAVRQAHQLAAEIRGLGTVAPPASPEDLEQLVVDTETPNGPLARFVFMQADVPESTTADRAEVRASYRCWPERRYAEIRDDIRALARPVPGATVTFAGDPFPAMVCPRPEGEAVKQYLRSFAGRDRVRTLHAALPFSGEDFAHFLNRLPGSGTYTFLGVRRPGAAIETSYPHFASFDPDERAIAIGVRAMAGWLASRTC